MAKPKVFVSSTYYDLRYARAELENFIGGFGYEPILHERGHVAYGSDKELQEYCYREIENIDILISIIGSRFGAESHKEAYSISQMELKTAQHLKKQVYIFIENSVYYEFQTYKANKGNASVKYNAVDDIRVFAFLEEMYGLPINNPIFAFEKIADVQSYLREQWAGLFQRFLWEARQPLITAEGEQRSKSEAELDHAQADLEKQRKLFHDQKSAAPQFSESRLRLSEARTEGVELRNRGGMFVGPNAQKDYEAWISRTLTWASKVENIIRSIDPADSEWFKTLDAVPPARVPHMPLDRWHTKAFNEHDYRLFRLNELIERYANRQNVGLFGLATAGRNT